MRARGSALIAAALLLTGCGGASDAQSQDEQPATASPTRNPPAPSSTAADDAWLDLAVKICTDGLREPDTLVYDAAEAARAGTRSVAEIADAFRQAQDAAEGLAGDAERGELAVLSQSLQNYADVLGRARVRGDAGLTEILDAREAINTACMSQVGSPPSS